MTRKRLKKEDPEEEEQMERLGNTRHSCGKKAYSRTEVSTRPIAGLKQDALSPVPGIQTRERRQQLKQSKRLYKW
jgi:hypothetical protein